MIIVIDAYNVLKGIHKGELISQVQRDGFVRTLSDYAREKQHHVYIVFDGTCDVQWSSRRLDIRKNKWCTVIYAGEGRSADHILKKLVHDLQRRDVLLVSSDRQVYLYAEKLEIPSIGAQLFYGYVLGEHEHDQKVAATYDQEAQAGLIKKRQGHESSQELDDLMAQASDVLLYKKEDFSSSSPKQVYVQKKKKISKKERLLEKVIKKL